MPSPTPWLTERHGYDPTCTTVSLSKQDEGVKEILLSQKNLKTLEEQREVGGQAVLGRQLPSPTPWLT
ncbi:hypothetical protein, partial [Enterobacter hormaechei]